MDTATCGYAGGVLTPSGGCRKLFASKSASRTIEKSSREMLSIPIAVHDGPLLISRTATVTAPRVNLFILGLRHASISPEIEIQPLPSSQPSTSSTRTRRTLRSSSRGQGW